MPVPRSNGLRTLVVDDDALSRTILRDLLTAIGYEVELAEDGGGAWEVFQAMPAPLLITDWLMPGVDGPELCRRVRSAGADRYTWIIMLTALEGRANFLEGMEAGADDFLTKPVDESTLRARLRVAERVLGLHRTVRNLRTLLPVCMYCHRIRDPNDDWHGLEDYIARETESEISHGVCAACAAQHLGAT